MKLYYLFGLILLMIFGGCSQKSEYEQWVSSELDKGIQRDSLFLGYHFGMSQQDFFDHSWKLNDQKKVMQGAGNRSVRYEIPELDNKAKMNFYPKFHNGEIFIMPVQYSYKAWAPWNKELWADSLMPKLIDLYEKKYGAQFSRMQQPDLGRSAYVSIQGNRSISMYKKDDQHVEVIFTNLEVREQLKDSVEKDGK